MNSACDQLFASAGFAFYENVRVRGCDFFDEAEDGLQRFARAYDFRKAVATIKLAAQRAVLAEKLARDFCINGVEVIATPCY